MTRQEWNDAIDKYIEEENDKIGKPVIVADSIPGSWPQVHSYVSEDTIRTFVWDIGYNDPLYYDPEYAKKTKWKGLIAPPGRFVHYIAETGSLARGNEVPGQSHLYGGTLYEYYDVIRAGDTFSIRDEYLGVEEKKLPPEKADKYRLLVMKAKRHYINQHGKTVVTATGNTVITCTYPDETKEKKDGVFKPYIVPHYEQAALDEIHRYYEDYCSGKYTRGAKIRYWEDVNEGDEIPKLIKGPLDMMDMVSYLCAIGAMHGNSATKWNIVKYSATVSPKDPETGEILHRQLMHLNPTVAKSMGFPNSLAYAAMTEAYVSEAVTDWMGDDGFVKSIGHKHRRAIFHGDMLYISGVVNRKYIEDGEHLVELKLTGKNQNGVEICPSTAVVKLVSKEM